MNQATIDALKGTELEDVKYVLGLDGNPAEYNPGAHYQSHGEDGVIEIDPHAPEPCAWCSGDCSCCPSNLHAVAFHFVGQTVIAPECGQGRMLPHAAGVLGLAGIGFTTIANGDCTYLVITDKAGAIQAIERAGGQVTDTTGDPLEPFQKQTFGGNMTTQPITSELRVFKTGGRTPYEIAQADYASDGLTLPATTKRQRYQGVVDWHDRDTVDSSAPVYWETGECAWEEIVDTSALEDALQVFGGWCAVPESEEDRLRALHVQLESERGW